MKEINFEVLLETAIEASERAGRKILEIYYSQDHEIELKEDSSPVTLADREADNIITEILGEHIPILSEEGKEIPYSIRREWEYFWMVDPLDGTKEFINRNGQFTVNIALIHKSYPVLGVVYCPTSDKTYRAIQGKGAFLKENGNIMKLTKSDADYDVTRIVSSRLHTNKETKEFIEAYRNVEVLTMGSSLKFMMLAEGKADIYPRFFPTMEWDTAASHIIVEESGGEVLQANTEEKLTYNKENLLNPSFIARRR